MMARQAARQLCRLGEIYSVVYGCRVHSENGPKLAASHSHWLGEPPDRARPSGYLG